MAKHYATIHGNGEDINIFLPGTGWSGDFGMPIVDALKDSHTTHMIDLPGIGRSEGLEGVITLNDGADWLNDYLEANSIHKVNIIGHSLGSALGLAFSLKYLHKVKQLI